MASSHLLQGTTRQRSAKLSAAHIGKWAKRRSACPWVNRALQMASLCAQAGLQGKEPASWSISPPQNGDRAKAAATCFSQVRSLSWVWLATLSSKAPSGPRRVAAPLRPNRKWHTSQTKPTHVTRPLKGGCNSAVAFCVSVFQRCTGCAQVVHANHTPFSKVVSC